MKRYKKITSYIILFFIIVCLTGCSEEKLLTDEKLLEKSVENELEQVDAEEAEESLAADDTDIEDEVYYEDDFDYSPYLKKTCIAENYVHSDKDNDYISFIFTKLENGQIEGYFSIDFGGFCRYTVGDSICDLYVFEYPDFARYGYIQGHVKDGTAYCAFVNEYYSLNENLEGSMEIVFLDNGELDVTIDADRVIKHSEEDEILDFIDGEYHFVSYDLSYIDNNANEDMTHTVMEDKAFAIYTAFWENAYFVPVKVNYGRFYYRAYITNRSGEILYDLGVFPLDTEIENAYHEDINGDGLMDIRIELNGSDDGDFVYRDYCQTDDGLFVVNYSEEQSQHENEMSPHEDDFDYSPYLKKTWVAEDYEYEVYHRDENKRLYPSFIFTKLEDGQIEGYFVVGSVCEFYDEHYYGFFRYNGYIQGTVKDGTAQCTFSYSYDHCFMEAVGSMEIVFLDNGELEANVTYSKMMDNEWEQLSMYRDKFFESGGQTKGYEREQLLDGKYHFYTYDLDCIADNLSEDESLIIMKDKAFEISTSFWEEAYFVPVNIDNGSGGLRYAARLVNRDGEILYNLSSLGDVIDGIAPNRIYPEDVNGDGLIDIRAEYSVGDELWYSDSYQTETGLFEKNRRFIRVVD